MRRELRAPGDWLVVHRVLGPVESVVARRWDDLVELVIPAGRQGVQGVYAEEGVVSRLMDSAVAVRRVCACDDTLVALSEQRDRLLVLNADSPGRTALEVPVARMLGQSIQDACIVTAKPAAQRHGARE